jgi:hypothetical protein
VICWVLFTLPILFRIARRFAMVSRRPFGSWPLRYSLFLEDAPELLEGGG